MKKLYALLVCLITIAFTSFAYATSLPNNLKLEEMVVLSRHNIRSPLSDANSELGKITPHKWHKWTSAPSELSLKGGELETLMGQYFRLYLIDKGLITENYVPKPNEFRFYANSMQRTIATAQYFSSGMLPIANVKIEHKFAPSKMDPVFHPQLTVVNDKFKAKALAQIAAMGGQKGLQGITENLKDNYNTISKVLDSDKVITNKDHRLFKTDDLGIKLELNKEPNLTGSLKLATKASDALTLQYYEEPNDLKAGFGKNVSPKDWDKISHVKDVYGDVLFSAPVVAINVAHPLLEEIAKEINLPNRKFTYLVGHDSNLVSVLSALEAEPYNLPKTIEKKTPIGSKFVIEKYKNLDNQQEYIKLSLVYQSTDQIRHRDFLTLDNPPVIYPIKLQGLKANQYGMYSLQDFNLRLNQAISAYNDL